MKKEATPKATRVSKRKNLVEQFPKTEPEPIPLDIRPLGDRLLVLQDGAMTMTKAGIYIPESAQEKQSVGTVAFIGPKVEELQPGDRVLFDKQMPTVVTIAGQEYLAMRESMVYTKL